MVLASVVDSVLVKINSFFFASYHKGKAMFVRWLFLALFVSAAAPTFAQDARQLGLKIKEAQQFTKQGDTLRAMQSYHDALPYAKRVFGPQAKQVGVILAYIGELHRDRGEPAKAKPYLSEALQLYERLGDPNLRAEGINNLAAVHMDLGEFSEAKELNEQAVELIRKLQGPESGPFAKMQANLAVIDRVLGQEREAEQLLRSSIRILQKIGADEEKSLANVYMNLATLYQANGEVAKAETLYLETIRIYEKLFGVDTIEPARARGNLATLYQSVSQWDKAIAEHQRSLKVFQTRLGAESLDAARSMANLANIATLQEKPELAEELYRQVLAIREKKLGANHPDIALTRLALGLALVELKRMPEAREQMELSLRIRREAIGPESREVADTLTSLGLLEVRNGQPQQGMLFLEQAFGLRTKILPEWHVDVAMAHANKARALGAQQNWKAAAAEFASSRRGIRNYINQVLPTLADQEQVDFLRRNDEPHLHGALGLALQLPLDQVIVRESGEWALNGKAVVQQSVAERALLARDRNDPQLKVISVELQRVRKQLATLANQTTGQAAAKQKELVAQERELARQVSLRSGRAPVSAWVGLDEVRAKLPAKGVFVNFVRWHPFDYTSGKPAKEKADRYIAWLMRADQEAIQFLDLGECDVIDRAITEARTELNRAPKSLPELGEKGAEAELRKSLLPLTELILKPILSKAGNVEHLLLSPDSMLWLVPWCALPVEGEKYLLEEMDLCYLVSGRELVEQAKHEAAGVPVLFADPAYDLEPNAVLAATREVFRQAANANPQPEQTIRSMKSRLGAVERLPATLLEANAVQPSIKEFTAKDSQLYSDKFALEAVFKALRQPRVLMLSTHGFFRDASVTAGGDSTQGNPLLGCGLMLAGCNRPPVQLVTTAEDGVLTALEIVETDLRGTELVVLSACETGLGTVRNGEGVAGLRQAFQLAGAQAVVSTLWSIPDRDSALIVVEFFQQLASGSPKAAALQKAQLKRLNSRRDRSGAAHPFYWAAWTLTGS